MAGIMIIFYSVVTGGVSIIGGIGMGFLHLHLKKKGFVPWKIAMASNLTAGVLGLGLWEGLSRASSKDIIKRKEMRNIYSFPLIAGLGSFVIGYGGVIVSRYAIVYGKKRFEKYIKDVTK